MRGNLTLTGKVVHVDAENLSFSVEVVKPCEGYEVGEIVHMEYLADDGDDKGPSRPLLGHIMKFEKYAIQ